MVTCYALLLCLSVWAAAGKASVCLQFLRPAFPRGGAYPIGVDRQFKVEIGFVRSWTDNATAAQQQRLGSSALELRSELGVVGSVDFNLNENGLWTMT